MCAWLTTLGSEAGERFFAEMALTDRMRDHWTKAQAD